MKKYLQTIKNSSKSANYQLKIAEKKQNLLLIPSYFNDSFNTLSPSAKWQRMKCRKKYVIKVKQFNLGTFALCDTIIAHTKNEQRAPIFASQVARLKTKRSPFHI